MEERTEKRGQPDETSAPTGRACRSWNRFFLLVQHDMLLHVRLPPHRLKRQCRGGNTEARQLQPPTGECWGHANHTGLSSIPFATNRVPSLPAVPSTLNRRARSLPRSSSLSLPRAGCLGCGVCLLFFSARSEGMGLRKRGYA